MLCQVESDIEAGVKHFTITFKMYIRSCRSSAIIELQKIVLQIACGRQIEKFECDNTDWTRRGTKIVKRKIS